MMRVKTMRKLLKKIKSVEKQTNSTAIEDGFFNGFMITLCKNGDVMARAVFDEKWTLNDCMNELERFKTNAFLNIRKREGVRKV